MAHKFVRSIKNIKNILKQSLNTNDQNDILSDDKHCYIRNKDGYYCLTDSTKSINDIKPDENGNIIIPISGIKTFNNHDPMEDGRFFLLPDTKYEPNFIYFDFDTDEETGYEYMTIGARQDESKEFRLVYDPSMLEEWNIANGGMVYLVQDKEAMQTKIAIASDESKEWQLYTESENVRINRDSFGKTTQIDVEPDTNKEWLLESDSEEINITRDPVNKKTYISFMGGGEIDFSTQLALFRSTIAPNVTDSFRIRVDYLKLLDRNILISCAWALGNPHTLKAKTDYGTYNFTSINVELEPDRTTSRDLDIKCEVFRGETVTQEIITFSIEFMFKLKLMNLSAFSDVSKKYQAQSNIFRTSYTGDITQIIIPAGTYTIF